MLGSTKIENVENVARVLAERHYASYPSSLHGLYYKYELDLLFSEDCQKIAFPEWWGIFLRKVTLVLTDEIRSAFYVEDGKLVVALPQNNKISKGDSVTFTFHYERPILPTERERDSLLFFKYPQRGYMCKTVIFQKGIPRADMYFEVPAWYELDQVTIIRNGNMIGTKFDDEYRGAAGTTYHKHIENLGKNEEVNIGFYFRLSLSARLWILSGLFFGLSIWPMLFCSLLSEFMTSADVVMVSAGGIAILMAVRSWLLYDAIERSKQDRIDDAYLMAVYGILMLGTLSFIHCISKNIIVVYIGVPIFTLFEVCLAFKKYLRN